MQKRGKVFMSYRRDGGAELARNIRDALQKRRFDVFMDVEDLRGGYFNKALYQQIEAASDVVVVLTPGSLDRCFDSPEDWLRLELAHALKQKKNIVPVLHRGFQWPDRQLPDDLCALAEQNSLSSSHDYFEASMDRLTERLLVGWAPPVIARKRLLVIASAACVIAAAIGLLSWHNRRSPSTQLPSATTVVVGTPTPDAMKEPTTKALGLASTKAPTPQSLAPTTSSRRPGSRMGPSELAPSGEQIQVELQDGSTINAKLVTNYSELFYSEDINNPYLRKEGNNYIYLWRKIRLISIASMDYYPLNETERSRMGPREGQLPASVVKVDVTFRNGEIKNRIYIIVGLSRWVSDNENGELYSPLIKRVVFK